MTDDNWDPRAPAAINQAAGQNNRAPMKEQKERIENSAVIKAKTIILMVTLFSFLIKKEE